MRLHLHGGMLGAAEFALGDEIEISDALAAGYRIHQDDDERGFIHGTPMMRCKWSAWVGSPVVPRPEWPANYGADARLLPPNVLVNPDCKAGKHDACNGDAWDTVQDAVTECPCTCHTPNGEE